MNAKLILIFGIVVIVLILTFGEDTIPEKSQIIYLNNTNKTANFNIMYTGNAVFPSHPLIGWVVFISAIIVIYFIVKKIFGVK